MKTEVLKQKPFILLIILLFIALTSIAQSAVIEGNVSSEGKAVEFANVALVGTNYGVSTNEIGNYKLKDIPSGKYLLHISAIGYKTFTDSINLKKGEIIKKEIDLKLDVFNLSQVVVTGTRNKVERYNSPVIVNTVDAKTFDATQSMNIAEGLNFSPGLRVENNCQNCGFTQLRMNGLDGPYSQVLINSRAVFSALAGVYGLEMLPSSMVDRIEVVRGGGSVLYGGNAIAGTVNIITKDPFENSFEAGINQSLINGEASDRTFNLNGSVVSEDLNKGITFFGFNRNRDHWDANGDGFSEIVELKNNTFGFDAFYNIDDYKKLKLGTYFIDEYRRGGNKFDLAPHQADLAEQVEHDIINANLEYEQRSKNNKHAFSLYASIQHVNRDSYYGGGGRVLQAGDSLTEEDVLAINAYGNSEDISTVSGIQYNYSLNKFASLTVGTEYIYNHVVDEMPGYGRLIDQEVGTWGTFAEIELKPSDRMTFLLGARFDQLRINGQYDLVDESYTNEEFIPVVVPRLSAMYSLRENLKLRASFAQGYRGPQAFDEDLHIETVGGAARFIQLSPDLQVERSNSLTLSLNYDKYLGRKQMNFVVEGFYTQLNNPFILSDQTELPNGISVVTKRNGSGAVVSGLNLEANLAIGSELIIQSGATLQTAIYNNEEIIWSPDQVTEEVPETSTDRLLRTPNTYGYLSLSYFPKEFISISYSAVYTGSMDVAHLIDPETERTIIENTPSFLENNIKVGYTFKSENQYNLEVFGGVQNIFNSYQEDFDTGAERDVTYVYGPLRPRTFFLGLKFGLD